MSPSLRIAGRLAAVVLVALALCGGAARVDPAAHAPGHAVSDARSAGATDQAGGGDLQSAIQAALIRGVDTPSSDANCPPCEQLNELYAAVSGRPLWLDGAGRPSPDARVAVALLRSAIEDGLDPADYHSDHVERLMARLDVATAPALRDAAAFDTGVSAGMLRYLRHLHVGRVDPRATGFGLTIPADHHDYAVQLRSALDGHQIREQAARLRPAMPQYGALRAALATYRRLEAATALEPLPPFTGAVRAGERYTGVAALRQRLQVLGDLPADAASPDSGTYGGALVDGVRRFQSRHGLDPDGILGRSTVAALNVPLASRVRQIELALERLRWLPHLRDDRLVAINIPMFRLWMWDSIKDAPAPASGMAVIVGKALRTQTPVFIDEMLEVVFRPYWNIPRSILMKEILPALTRDPDYLRKQDMEIVRGDTDQAIPVATTPENIAGLRNGALRLRQRPGPRNSLGLIKFVFPNDDNVYLHGTPAPSLFRKSRRDFSHGCIRVDDPVTLAEWALHDRPEWTRDRIHSAMAGTPSLRVRLLKPIQVMLFYTTAAVVPGEGAIQFAEDIYHHDARLEQALAEGLPGR